MKITVRNVSHGTETRINARAFQIDVKRVHAIRRRLCGVAGCSCGGDLSERGSDGEHAIEDSDGRPMIFHRESCGGTFYYD